MYNYNEETDSFIGITSKYLPIQSDFIRFWENTITVLSNDYSLVFNHEIEIDINIPLVQQYSQKIKFPIHIAIDNSDVNMVKLFIKDKDDKFIYDALIESVNSFTSSHIDKRDNSKQIVLLILEQSKDFNEKNNNMKFATDLFFDLQLTYDVDILTNFFNKCSSSFLQAFYVQFRDRDVGVKYKEVKTNILKLIWNHHNLSKIRKFVTLRGNVKGGFLKTKTRRILKSVKRRVKRTIHKKRKYQITRRQLIK